MNDTIVVNLRSLLVRDGRFYSRGTFDEVLNAIYIGRYNYHYGLQQSPWSNPYTVEQYGRDMCIHMYETDGWQKAGWEEKVRRELSGKVLVCWCSPLRCHGDVLARIANRHVV